jgi:hypothetical protein
MLDTFKTRLKAKAKAAGANLSQKRIDAIADRLHGKYPDLTEETDHDDKIDSLYDAQDYKDFASVDDYQRAKEAREKKEREASKTPEKSGSESEQPADDMPAWFRKYQEENDRKINALLAKEQKQTMQQKLAANEKLKSIPQQFYKGRPIPEKEEDIETFVSEVEADFNDFKTAFTGVQQQEANNSFSAGSKPPASAGSGNNAVDPAIKAFADKQKARLETTKK